MLKSRKQAGLAALDLFTMNTINCVDD